MAQAWQPFEAGRMGYYRLKNSKAGSDLCLDVRNDETDEILHLVGCGNYSGQFWRFDIKN
jgi:hypothetical protein